MRSSANVSRMLRKLPVSVFVAAALDPAFRETPFQPGQSGERLSGVPDLGQPSWPSGPASVIWCASYDELQQTHPRLPQAHDQGNAPLGCVDFTVEIDADGTLSRADLEADSLSETFLMIGLDHEARVAVGLMGEPARDVCQVLPHLISTLLERLSA